MSACTICVNAFANFNGHLSVVKELTIVDNETLKAKQWVFKPPYSPMALGLEERLTNNRLGKFIYGVYWHEGNEDYKNLEQIVMESIRRYKFVFTSGNLQVRILRGLVGNRIIDLSELGGPDARSFTSQVDINCCILKHNEKLDLICSKRIGLKFAEWCRSHKEVTDFLQYEARLKSLEKFPNKYVKKEDLALDGFYYIFYEDFVVCVYCDLIMHNWEKGDVPHEEHKKWNPRCRLIRGVPLDKPTTACC